MDTVPEDIQPNSTERSKIIEEEVEALDVRDLERLKTWMDKNIVRFPVDIDTKTHKDGTPLTKEEKVTTLYQEFADVVNQNPPTEERPTAKYFEGPIKFNLKFFAEPAKKESTT
jgi:hypothetical protein